MDQKTEQPRMEKMSASVASKSPSVASTQIMRQTAYPISIAHMLHAKFEQRQGWDPSVIHVDGVAIARVNIFGVLVSFSQGQYLQAVLDDGTGQITLRAFEQVFVPDSVTIGSIVLVIGRPRKYNEQLFLVPEIIRPLTEKKFLDIRRSEIEKRWKPIEKMTPIEKNTSIEKTISSKQTANTADDANADELFHSSTSFDSSTSLDSSKSTEHHFVGDSRNSIDMQSAVPNITSTQIIEYIDSHDKGPGVALDDIRKAFVSSETEKNILQLMLGGEIFEIRPGRVKVLK